MRTFNHCIFVGHAGSEPKLLTTGNGKSFTKFRLAVANYASAEKSEESEQVFDSFLIGVVPEVITVTSAFAPPPTLRQALRRKFGIPGAAWVG